MGKKKEPTISDSTSKSSCDTPIHKFDEDVETGSTASADTTYLPDYHRSSVVFRGPMNQAEFDEKFAYKQPEEEDEFNRQLKKYVTKFYKPFTSCAAFRIFLLELFPILTWLPQYRVQENIFSDIVGGITVGIMQVPQGIAYAFLARQSAVTGIYTSLFPPLIYMLFGTSRHSCIGSFSVISLMCGIAVDRLIPNTDGPLSNSTLTTTMAPDSAPQLTPTDIASAILIAVGLIQLLMGVFRLSFLTTYLSDQVVSGFTTAASFHVFVSQLKDLFGLRRLPKRTGITNLIMNLYDIVINIPNSNLVACAFSAFTLITLHLGKEYINPYAKRRFKLKVPIPFELITVIIGATVVYVFEIQTQTDIKTVGPIPIGFPEPFVPRVWILPDVYQEAISITIVSIAIHMSLSKMFAKKKNYEIDCGQELFALSFSSFGSSMFPVYPVACSLGRTMVNVEAGSRTQLSTVFASIIVLSVMFFFGQFLETLPMSIWVVSFFSTVLIDVTEGLIISVCYALFTTIAREQWPRWHLLGNVKGTNDYRDAQRYQDVCFFSGICMFRFDSPLLFTNVERFKKTVDKAYREWEKSHEFYVIKEERHAILMNLEAQEAREEAQSKAIVAKEEEILNVDDADNMLSRHFIVDCSGFTFVDYMGVSSLKEVYSDMRNRGILVYFAAAKAPVRELFELSGFYSFVAKENFYPTIRDAVTIARKRQLEGGHTDTVYLQEHDRLTEIISSQPID